MTPTHDTDDTDDDVDDDELDVIFDALANRTRRTILRHLADGGTTSVPMLVGLVRTTTDQNAKMVRASLYHQQLPRLDDVGAVDWDRDAGQVRPGPAIDQFLEPLPD